MPYSPGIVRITGGSLRGRAVKVPGSGVRPTQDRVREALFSMLADRVSGCRFLDLFAGSGAVGLEAWSRGAAHVCWVEANARVLRILRQNVESCCGGAGSVIRADAVRFLKKSLVECPFDIVFADPPYEKEPGGPARQGGKPGKKIPRRGPRRLESVRVALERSGLLRGEGVFVFEQGAREETPEIPGWRSVGDRVYGDSRIRLFRRADRCGSGQDL